MKKIAIAMDLGTSGFRAQAMEITTGRVLSTVITNSHPLPGSNVIDHLHFALDIGIESTRELILKAVNRVLSGLQIACKDVARLAVCGNPTQLSLFQGLEIRDLAFAGSSRLKRLGVRAPKRRAAIRRATDFPGLELPDACDVIIPPAVHDEVGADALALVIQSGILNSDDTAIAIDYGTNAEMVLAHNGKFYTASAAAGPALEGQHISCGTLAVPGAIADVESIAADSYRLLILDDNMQQVDGPVVNLRKASELNQIEGVSAKAITGTGVIAVIDQALQAGIITIPKINTADNQLHLGSEIYFTEADLEEAGKAIGAIRAGYFTLSLEAGIAPDNIHTAYLAGASGTYVDARKSVRLGLIPPAVN
jgi:methylamine methyltransferase corrinoid protein reductive activase